MSSSRCTSKYERFVPLGNESLIDDAPGWAGEPQTPRSCHDACSNDKDEAATTTCAAAGPICWKCRGTGSARIKKAKGSNESLSCQEMECVVCGGCGRLAPKRKETEGASKPGTITRGRRHPKGWRPSGPMPKALGTRHKWSKYVELANEDGGNDVQIKQESNHDDTPSWIPRQGEELCNLVGSWRILQRVGSHRWTTDDLVTAYVASLQVPSQHGEIKYLDLGTGNASVLQMVTWALLKENRSVVATGIEARLEAVELARRSLSFNLGSDSSSIARIVHGDFRNAALSNTMFDLITGTPPYFRVDFTVDKDTSMLVTSAVINQGGMPTAKQSAPARCEFRGGIEAYCVAASRVLRPDTGRFVVCENWLNHDRVVAAADICDLHILSQLEVSGKQGRNTLFCVYVMKKKENDKVTETTRETLCVRDSKGNWTDGYRTSVLKGMSIPYPLEGTLT